MRLLLLCLAVFSVWAGDAPLPATSQKAIDDATAAATKAHDAYLLAVKKEQDKALAVLQKDLDRETKKGNLDGALAIKARIEEVQGGSIQRNAESAPDLLGESKTPAKPTLAGLATDCPTATSHNDEAPGWTPEVVAKLLAGSTSLTLVKGDRTRYNFSLQTAGSVVVVTGSSEHNNSDVWRDLTAAGFKHIEGASEGWFLLEAKAGARFVAYDPPNAMGPLRLFAARIDQRRP